MSYQVLARKWRPRSFAELVGQEHVVQALVNALGQGRLHHAYLFTGTRGVGKTTVARILAKALNCEAGVGAEPCGSCSSCQELDAGRFIDLIEVDAASRTKVEETRELLENVQYSPTRGRYKVYLIDEVHMFSGHSFNALLKTLEEPPPHVVFLLATTDPQKLPATILSRCLQFNLKRLPLERIHGQFRRILDAEGIAYEQPALERLARAADGSMRDGLSLLDQALAFGAGQVRDDEVRTMLGDIGADQAAPLLQALADGDAGALLAAVARLAERAPDYSAVLEALLRLLHRIAVVQVEPDGDDPEAGDHELVAGLAARIPAEDVQLYYQVALLGRRDLDLAPDPRRGCEMTLLRMHAFRPAASAPAGAAPATPQRSAAPAASRAPAADAPPASTASSAPPAPPPAAMAAPAASDDDWHARVARLNLGGMARQLANHCTLVAAEPGAVTLRLDPASEQLRTPRTEQAVAQALAEEAGRPVRLTIETGAVASETPAARAARLSAERQVAAERSIASDPHVQALREAFGAEVDPASVRPR
jgi:DNA polymerase-3 subunit gamma/tau